MTVCFLGWTKEAVPKLHQPLKKKNFAPDEQIFKGCHPLRREAKRKTVELLFPKNVPIHFKQVHHGSPKVVVSGACSVYLNLYVP